MTDKRKEKNKYTCEVEIRYVGFSTPEQREKSYGLYADATLNSHSNKARLSDKTEKSSKGLENIVR